MRGRLTALSSRLYATFYRSVLRFFKSVNQRARKRILPYYVERETSEHVAYLAKVLKWVVVPASLMYVSVSFGVFGENTLDSMCVGLLIFVYSNFLPDLPAIYRRKKPYGDRGGACAVLSRKKKYALLLFAPAFVALLLCGIRLRWQIPKTYHNVKSLTVYAAFLLLLSGLAFGAVPLSTGALTEMLFVPLCGALGYLTHLRVDKRHHWTRVRFS